MYTDDWFFWGKVILAVVVIGLAIWIMAATNGGCGQHASLQITGWTYYKGLHPVYGCVANGR